MNKKILSALLLGAFMVASTSTFVSCKDYDDDINDLQAQIDALNVIKAQFEKGVIITSVTQDGKDVKVTTSDGNTYTVKGGEDGKDADVWTIVEGYWYKNGVNQNIKAVGADGGKGPDGIPGENGNYWKYENGYLVEYNGTTKQPTGEKHQIVAEGGSSAQQVVVVQSGKGYIFTGVENGPVFIPTVADLTSLVFIPQTYYWGIEAAQVTRFTPKWYLANGEKDGNVTGNWKDLFSDESGMSYIDNDEQRKEVIGTQRPGNYKENSVTYTDENQDLDVHERYNQSTNTVTIMLNAKAEYHWNPSIAYNDEDTKANIRSANKTFTRGEGNAVVSLLGAPEFGNNDKLFVSNGILQVPLQVSGTVGTVYNHANQDFEANPGVTTFATQITYAKGDGVDTTVTSDYAAIIEQTVKDLRLAHVKHHTTGVDPEDFIETKVFNTHCGVCQLAESLGHGMHLFATVGEAKYFVMNSYRFTNGVTESIQGEGQDLVQYDEDIDLTALVETHYTNEAGNHAKFTESFDENFAYEFELTDFRYDDRTATNESAHAAIYKGTDGHYYLHPQDPEANGLNGRPYDAAKATEVVVNRIPLVRVSLVYVGNNNHKVIDYGYLPIRIIKEKVEAPKHYITVEYTSDKDAKLTRYNDCYTPGGSDIVAYSTNWRQTEEDLMSHPELANVLTHEEFRSHYTPQYTVSGALTNLDQYYISGTDANGKPVFTLVDNSTNLNHNRIGEIIYHDENVAPGAMTNTLVWNIDAAVIQQLATATPAITQVTRAILLKSDDPVNYPDIYVIFNSGAISLENKTVTANIHLSEKIIAEYWYTAGNAPFQKGTTEIHTNVVTPEENPNKTGGNTGANAWKPVKFENTFANVFLNNFEGNTPADWITFDGAPTEIGQPFTANNIQFDIVFDNSNNGRTFKGKLDAGAAKTFTISNTTVGDNTKKNLYATYNLRTEKIASIEGTWDGTSSDYQNLQKVRIALNHDSQFALALLNYVSHEKIGEADVLKATVAFAPKSHSTDPFDVTNDEVKAAVPYYYNNNREPRFCPLKIEDYKFDVRFLRPVDIADPEGTVIEDATSSTDKEQVIKLSELIPGYTDFRSVAPAVNWKVGSVRGGSDNLDYETYYSPDGTDDFTVQVSGITYSAGSENYISQNDNVLTNLNQATPNDFVPLKEVSSLLDFKVTGPDELTYLNNSATVQEFQVKIPVEVSYYWGTIYDSVTITIKKTQGNARRF